MNRKMPRTAPSKRAQSSQARNKARTLAAVEMEGEVEFGRVVRNLGGRNMVILNKEKRECLAHIPGALAHRSSTPIISGSIVVVIPRNYESRAKEEKRYDIFAVVQDKKDIRDAIKEGHIPDWMFNESSSSDVDVIEFDYDGIQNKEDMDTEDDSIDIDNI